MRVAVVGAGLAGLLAARTLVSRGHDVVVLDKGRSPGGRLATRRVAGAVLDHGAQFFTVRSDAFAELVARWQADGLIAEWNRGFDADPGAGDGHPRYLVRGGMNAVAKHLAAGLDVRCGQLAFSVHPGRVALDDGTCVDADAVVVAVPVPQALSLLMAGDVATPEALWHLAYDPTLALLVVLDGPGAVPEPGGVQEADEVFSFVADNHRKGVSPLPALTLHARPAWSRERYDDDPDAVHRDLLAAAGRWIGDAGVVESQLKKWRFATPTTTWTEPCLVLDTPSPIVLAGDAFAGPKMEGAALSGLAAAAAL